MAGHRNKGRAQPERPHILAPEAALPEHGREFRASNDNRGESEEEKPRTELTPAQEATKSVFALAFVFVLIFVCAVVLVMLAPFDPSDLFMSFTAGVIVAWLAARLMLRGIEVTVGTLGEVSAHQVLFLSAFGGLAGLLFGLEFVPEEYPVEAKTALVTGFVVLCAALPFVLWAISYGMRRLWDFTANLLRPSAERAAARVKAIPERARGVHLAATARVSRIPLLIKALSGGCVAVAAGTVAILALPPLIVPQGHVAPRPQTLASVPRQPERRITTPVLTHPREPAPVPLAIEAPPPILQPVAVIPPYHSRYLRFFQHHHRQHKSRGGHKGIRP